MSEEMRVVDEFYRLYGMIKGNSVKVSQFDAALESAMEEGCVPDDTPSDIRRLVELNLALIMVNKDGHWEARPDRDTLTPADASVFDPRSQRCLAFAFNAAAVSPVPHSPGFASTPAPSPASSPGP